METSLSPDQLPKLGRSVEKSKHYRIDLGSTERAKDVSSFVKYGCYYGCEPSG